MKAITPSEAKTGRESNIPDVVIEVFNHLIQAKYRDGDVTVGQDEVVKLLVKKGLKRDKIFDEGWLDVESIYEKAGWSVNYDKPGYNETYPATFTFSKKR